MTVIQVELIDLRARQLLEDMAKMDLIRIHDDQDAGAQFSELLTRLRKSAESVPSLSEITQEVETVRTVRASKDD